MVIKTENETYIQLRNEISYALAMKVVRFEYLKGIISDPRKFNAGKREVEEAQKEYATVDNDRIKMTLYLEIIDRKLKEIEKQFHEISS